MERPSHIEYHRFQRNEGCTEEGCRARKFYIEDGKKFCQRGHEQAGFTQTQQDEDDWNVQGRRSRKKREETEQAARIVRGREAAELYLQCYQLILWKQCHSLLTVKGLPQELETVIRDLWSLRIRALQVAGEEKSGYSSGGLSSTSDRDNTDSDTADTRSWASRRTRIEVTRKDRLPRLIESLALCYLGTLLTRLPICVGEFYYWATNDEMPYTRAIKEVPKEMRARLPAHFHTALEIRAPLRAQALQGAVSKMVEFYNVHFEMVFPPLNTPPLILKHMRCLGLPVEIYRAVQNLATLLGLDFMYSTVQREHLGRRTYPEIMLVSLIVIAVKLNHPFDDIVRIPERESDPTTVKIDWNAWEGIMADNSWKESKVVKHMDTMDTDILTMNEGSMDEYLDWYQRTWIDDRDPKSKDPCGTGSKNKNADYLQWLHKLLELFPLPELLPRSARLADLNYSLQKLKDVQRTLVVQKSQQPEQGTVAQAATRPGDLYRRYRTSEELPNNAIMFYEMAAACGGTSVNMLVKSVFRAELQLGRWQMLDRETSLTRDIHEDVENNHTSSND